MKLISSQKRTLASSQKLAVILMALAIVMLAIALAIVNYLVSIDTFTDIDGTDYSIKRRDGSYGLYDANGYILESVVDDGKTYFLTDIGTMVSVSATGEATIFAVVDSEDGEGVSDYNRLMIYPRIPTTDINSIRVTNEYGTFTFERDKDGDMCIKGHESTAYDKEKYAYLESVCGNTTVIQKISSEALAKYGFEEYGLDNPIATVSVTSSTGKSYTLDIGKQIVSGNGYYVRLVGRDTVYIFNSYIGTYALCSIESFVTPLAVYPVTTSNYMFVYNFMVNSIAHNADGTSTMTPDIALTYWDLADRENTEHQTHPYKMTDPAMAAYTPSADAVYTVMNPFLDLKATVKKLGVTAAALEQYGLANPEKMLYYEFETTDADGKPYYLKNHLYISAVTENGTHYITADVYACATKDGDYKKLAAYDQILEIDRSYLPFMEWTSVDWVETDYFQINITVCDELRFTTKDYDVTFDITALDTNNDGKSDDVEVYLVQDGDDKKLAINNFKTLYLNLLGGKLFGTAPITDEEAQKIIADESRHLLTWTMKTATTKIERTYSYYWLSESKALLTVDGHSEFFVLTTAVEKTVQDAIDVANGIKITAVSPYTNIDK